MLKGIAIKKQRLSVKEQTISVFCAVVMSVTLPQVFHLMGYISGVGTGLGEAFLPMHLPVMLVGLLAGPCAGAITGFISPILSFLLTGMPTAVLLPFMALELCVYGATMGLLRTVKAPTTVKVLLTQAVGRAIRALAIVMAVYVFKNSAISVSIIWLSILKGIFGITMQLVLIPLIEYWIKK